MTDKQFNDAFTAAGGWFILTQYQFIANSNLDKESLLQKLFEKGFDAEIGGTRTRLNSTLRIIRESRSKEALEKIRDSKRINADHPEASQMAEEILATL